MQIAEMTPDGMCAYCLGNTLGSHGITERDEDRLENYSIILHLYLQKEKEHRLTSKYTFSISKCVPNSDGHAVCHLLSDLITEAADESIKRALLKDQEYIYKRFTGKQLQNPEQTASEFSFPCH